MGFHWKKMLPELELAVLLCGSIAAAASGDNLQITVLVYNNAPVSVSALKQAEVEAARVFSAAGIGIAWVNCMHGSRTVSDACAHVPRSDEFVLQIAPTGKTSNDSVFGEAFLAEDGRGKYCDLFFDRIEDENLKSRTNISRLLGTVAAHELGHLFLGLNAHSKVGIMAPVWKQQSLREVAMGTLGFTGDQSKLMKARLGREQAKFISFRSRNGRPGDY